jgi:hypothetical protein
MIAASINGIPPLKIPIIFVFRKLDATYKFKTTGCVNNPIAYCKYHIVRKRCSK